MRPNNNQFDDSQLDQILRSYGKSEPRAGFEQRMLAGLAAKRAESTKQSWHWRLIVTALAAGAIASMTILVVRKPVPHNTTLTNQVPSINTETSVASARTNSRPHVVTRPLSPQYKTQTAPQPHLDQFPSPAPLNEQEEMLVRYVQNRQPEAVMVARVRAELEKQNFARFGQTDAE